jgi:hypothetical protein
MRVERAQSKRACSQNQGDMRLFAAALCASLALATNGLAQTYEVAETLTIDDVPSWFPVGFCLLTHGERQYVAYYDAEHRMMVAARDLDQEVWQKAVLPSEIGWDSHNYVTLAVDDNGDLHLTGNMHGVPLIYFRTREAGDIKTFERVGMTGSDEERCTYPRFLAGADGTLLFTYRSGGSGNGHRLYNEYDPQSRSWSRFLDTPLFDGEGERNAYPHGPDPGPDGLFHVIWVWRDTPDCATNHHLSYARSPDLKRWETAAGTPVDLPLTLGQEALCVDPIPSHGGIINGCERLAFDREGRPMISYHKADEEGHMQVFVTRFEEGAWRSRAITSWDREITFSGGGAMPFIGIRISGLEPLDPDRWTLTWRHRDFGSGRIVLDEDTLSPVEAEVNVPPELPRELRRPRIEFDQMRVKLAADSGASQDPDVKYMLRWEALPAHHDRPRQPPLPPASRLQLVKLVR